MFNCSNGFGVNSKVKNIMIMVHQPVTNSSSPNNWVKVFKNGPSKICGRQPLCKFFKGCLPQISIGPFLNTLPQILHKISTNSNNQILLKVYPTISSYYLRIKRNIAHKYLLKTGRRLRAETLIINNRPCIYKYFID